MGKAEATHCATCLLIMFDTIDPLVPDVWSRHVVVIVKISTDPEVNDTGHTAIAAFRAIAHAVARA